MQRPTIELKVSQHSYIVNSYATALEAQEIQKTYFSGTRVELVGQEPKISEFNPGVQFEVQKEMINQMVVSMDGTCERIVDRCLELPNDEFQELVAHLDELVSKKKS